MILDIIKERMRFSGTFMLILRLIQAILLLFGDRISIWILLATLYMYKMQVNHLHVDYLIPMTNRERMLRRIILIFLINIEYITLFTIGTVLSGYLYNNGSMIKENFSVTLIWAFIIFVFSVTNGLTWRKADVFSYSMNVIYVIWFIGFACDMSGMLPIDKIFSFLSFKEVIIVLLIITCLFVIEMFRRCKRIKSEDFYEII